MEFRWLKKVILIGLLINLVILCVNFYIFNTFEIVIFNQGNHQPKVGTDLKSCEITVWSSASIGLYFWEHILRGEIQENLGDGYYRFGRKVVENLVFKFRSGYSLTSSTLNEYLKRWKREKQLNLILVLNGRTKQNVQNSEHYLRVLDHHFKNRRLNLGVILLGNEYCFNNWIKQYLDSGLIKFLFVVYDWNEIDNVNIFQWPLGVATYRNFSFVQINKDLVKNERRYLCSYLATVYKNTSRAELLNLMKQSAFKDRCLVRVRMQWSPNETNESSMIYKDALRNSDLTLSPLGENHECYRIYEAFSYLTVPILEENLNHVNGRKSNCDQRSSYRLLKEFKAPIRFVSNWTKELDQILFDELSLTMDDRMDRRIKLFNWYEGFRNSMRSRFVQVLKEKFNCN